MIRYRGLLVLATTEQGHYLRLRTRRVGYCKRATVAAPRPSLTSDQDVAVSRNPYLTMAALSGFTTLSVSTLRKLLRLPNDPLPSIVIGRRRLFRASDVDAWMRRRQARENAVDRALEALRARRAAR